MWTHHQVEKISLKLYVGGYDRYGIIVPLLEFLMDTCSTFKALTVGYHFNEHNYIPTINRFLMQFQNTLEKLWLGQSNYFSQIISSKKQCQNRKLTISWYIMHGVNNKNEMLRSVFETVTDVNYLNMSTCTEDRVTFDQLVNMILLFCHESLNEFSFVDDESCNVPLISKLVNGCPNIKTVHLTTYTKGELVRFEPLRTMHPHIKWELHPMFRTA